MKHPIHYAPDGTGVVAGERTRAICGIPCARGDAHRRFAIDIACPKHHVAAGTPCPTDEAPP